MLNLIIFLCVATFVLNQIIVAALLGKDWHPAAIKAIDKLIRITISPLIFLPAFFAWVYCVTVGGEAYRESIRAFMRYVDERKGGSDA